MMNNTETWAGIQNVNWIPVLKNQITLGSQFQIVPTEGYIAWEYNPLRNYRLQETMYECDGKYYTTSELVSKLSNLYGKEINLLDDEEKPLTEEVFTQLYGQEVLTEFSKYTLREPGELVDFITNELSFSLQHPVDILPQYSYDGSVNLVLNDGLNIPRLINSRFTVTGRNTYKVIDRKGDNDTNIYDQGEQFDVDTSLFKNVNKIPKLEYLGTSNGNLKIGNYHFYFKYADADGNESDWVAESGLVSVFIGTSPQSVNTGIRDENSIKSVRFKLSNIDIGYSFVKIYYTRYSSDIDSNFIVEAKRIDKNFIINNSGTCMILITGDENSTEVTLEEINSSFDVIQNAQTQCQSANRLFMANIHKTKVEYDMLSKLSLCFCPYKYQESYPLIDGIDKNYFISAKSDGYYDTQYIYNKTGYWPGELYRLGVAYILKDGSLSPVFNIRGATNIPVKGDNFKYQIEEELSDEDSLISNVLEKIEYSEEDFIIIGGKAENENAKGVIQLQTEPLENQAFPVLGISITADYRIIEELKKYCKGFFFVRQKRIPLTLCQGIVVGLDKESRTPTLPTLGDILTDVNTNNTFIETSDFGDINFISEGFLSRYAYSLKTKGTGFWKKLGTALAVVAVLAVAAVATVVTCGVGGAAVGVGVAAWATTSGFLGALGTIGIAAGTALGVATTALTIQQVSLKARIRRNKDKAAQPLEGRDSKIPDGYKREEHSDSRLLVQDILERYIIKDPTKNSPDALIVPDYQVNQPYYNQFLTGGKFTVKLTYEQPNTNFLTDGYFRSDQRHFYVDGYISQSDNRSYNVELVGVPDGCPIKMIGENKYCARAGYAEEAYKYEFQGNKYEDSTDKKDNSDIIRGNYGSFVGMNGYTGHACDQVNIMIPGYKENDLFNYVQLRAQDTSAFYAISDRIDINLINNQESTLQEEYKEKEDFKLTLFRGDSYICQYTHRINRNFNDPSAPYNDKIVDEKSWKNNYNPDKPEDYANINLGDVNAIQLGLWLTFWVRSSYNLNIRTIDKSNIDEYIMCGNYRSFYPHYGQLANGNQKIPDSDQYNKGFTKSLSEKYYFEIPDVPYIKQEFQNRIVFSDIHINDAYKNGFRVIRSMNHKDYPMTYGSITKLIELKNTLLVVFEHGVGLISINNSAEHPSQILSDLNMISDTYGSQWKDSIIKTPSGIYGVDTVAKKIWRVKEGQIEIISDMRVQEFLNQNITLSERELTPVMGIRNVKTLYNAFKHDVMFTFYDNLNNIQEKSWNLCWNEILGIFTTFYSWIPSEMQSIDNIPFSFDRDTVKSIAKLGISHTDNSFADGITLSNVVISDNMSRTATVRYFTKYGYWSTFEYEIKDPKILGIFNLSNRLLPDTFGDYTIEYQVQRDPYNHYQYFEEKTPIVITLPDDAKYKETVIYGLKLRDEESLKDYIYDEYGNEIWSEGEQIYTITKQLLPETELYHRNKEYNSYPDTENNMIPRKGEDFSWDKYSNWKSLPIFKNKYGKRELLANPVNADKLVLLLNIKAEIKLNEENIKHDFKEAYYNSSTYTTNAGFYESTIAIIPEWNLQFLSTDFWKHGQAGIIDIKDKILPTYWYGKQHPFEFECIVVDDPSVHKIFTNLELVANKVKPESFHYEIIGDVYDFSEDKPTMYFRQEALKALYQYNGYDIEYNPNFLEIEPKQHNRSADLPKYYFRQDHLNSIYDNYKKWAAPSGFNYDHLSGAEIVYYPTRNEFRVWNHTQAIDLDELNQDITTSIIKANCRYLEDKWLVNINPIIVTYKNEVDKNKAKLNGESIFSKDIYGVYKYSTWVNDRLGKVLLPPINISGTKLQEKLEGNIDIPNIDKGIGKDNALYGLYDLTEWDKGSWKPIDPTKNKDRQETDVRGKFVKVRIRYDGKELAIIDFLNTIYQISFA